MTSAHHLRNKSTIPMKSLQLPNLSLWVPVRKNHAVPSSRIQSSIIRFPRNRTTRRPYGTANRLSPNAHGLPAVRKESQLGLRSDTKDSAECASPPDDPPIERWKQARHLLAAFLSAFCSSGSTANRYNPCTPRLSKTFSSLRRLDCA